jgi:GxxExxY protein
MSKMAERLEDAAEEVHKVLGSGWSESVYHKALIRELSGRGIAHYTEGSLTVTYKGGSVGTRRPDLFVEGEDETIVVELKSGSARSSGENQLRQYMSMLSEEPTAVADISGGALIRFGDELDFEYFDSS